MEVGRLLQDLLEEGVVAVPPVAVDLHADRLRGLGENLLELVDSAAPAVHVQTGGGAVLIYRVSARTDWGAVGLGVAGERGVGVGAGVGAGVGRQSTLRVGLQLHQPATPFRRPNLNDLVGNVFVSVLGDGHGVNSQHGVHHGLLRGFLRQELGQERVPLRQPALGAACVRVQQVGAVHLRTRFPLLLNAKPHFHLLGRRVVIVFLPQLVEQAVQIFVLHERRRVAAVSGIAEVVFHPPSVRWGAEHRNGQGGLRLAMGSGGLRLLLT